MLIYDAPFNPPQEMRTAGYLLLAEFTVLVGYSFSSEYLRVSETAIQLIALAINFIACIFIGMAAKKLGKSWILYGLAPAVVLVLPGALLSYLKLRTAARYQWLDAHATYVKDGV